MKLSRHYIGLAIVILLGTTLRFWNLDQKPLWLDEVITALFSLGKTYNDVPLEVVLPISRFQQIFTLNPSVSCPEIAQNIINQSTHPPLFFCLMNSWIKLHLSSSIKHSFIWVLRSLPALFGVAAIAAIYYLNLIAFYPTAGLIGAAAIAVSPFAVYLSQEARHYTLPLFLITLSLIALIQIQQDISQKQRRPIVWLSWVLINSIGLYIHYFFILVIFAQISTILLLLCQGKVKLKNLFFSFIYCLLPLIFFLPWLPVVLGHSHRPETDWLSQPETVIPFGRTLLGWILMVIFLPLESQPLWVAIPLGIIMLIFGIWLGGKVSQGIKQLWQNPQTHLATLTLGSFTIFVLLEFFGIIYLLGKDISVAPRYNFIYYPSFCALLAASLVIKNAVQAKHSEDNSADKFDFLRRMLCPYHYLLLAGVISCIFVVNGLAFEKPYNPQRVAKNMLKESSVPLMVVMGYKDSQDVALGLSFALGIEKFNPKLCQNQSETCPKFAFFKPTSSYQTVWEKLSQLPKPEKLPLNLWVISPGLRRNDYPQKLALSQQTNCTKDSSQYYRVGLPYQLYKCH